jgi:hypothetical protein
VFLPQYPSPFAATVGLGRVSAWIFRHAVSSGQHFIDGDTFLILEP